MRSKWLVAALVLSVLLNLLAAGYIVGRATGAPRVISPDPTTGYGRLLRFLPDERRAAAMPVLRRHMREVLAEARGLRARHQAVYDALAADRYDPAALEAALGALRQSIDVTQEASHRSLVEVAALLSPAERRQLVEAMRNPPWRRDDRHRPPGPPPHMR